MESFPAEIKTVGAKIAYLSQTLLPEKRFDEYLKLYTELLGEKVHYVDAVHELFDRQAVLDMLAKYLPRVCNEKYTFELLHDGEDLAIWRWTIALKIRFSPFEMAIDGLVHAQIQDGKIVYQREYYDPMQSIEVIPVAGFLYKQMLRMG